MKYSHRVEEKTQHIIVLHSSDFVPLQSDIRDYDSLYKICEGVDCIFHTASYGMSGPEQVSS